MSSHLYHTKKRARQHNVGNAKRHRRSRELEVGMQGVLISCEVDASKCVAEACSLLAEYADQLDGAKKLCDKDDEPAGSEEQEEDDDDEGETAQTAPENEVDQSLTSTETSLRRFQPLRCAVVNILFVRTFNVEPEKLVHHILEDLYTTKQKTTQHLLRMLPISGTCSATPEDFRKYAETFLQPWFKAPNKGSFQIVYKARRARNMRRNSVLNYLTDIICSLNEKNMFDEINPDYTIIVEIIRDVCCLGVVTDYNLFKKYNLQEVVKSAE